jgi:hypothetical protein
LAVGASARSSSMAMQRGETQVDGDADKDQTLNFRVTAEFKKAFKGYAVAQGISMTDLLKEGFLLSKKAREK